MFIMKKLVIFLSLAMILLVVGCQKEDIRPSALSQTDSDSSNEKALRSSDSNDDNGKPVGTITDPNHDEDEDDKIKK